MKKNFKQLFKIGGKSNPIIRIMLLLMIVGSSTIGYAQTIGIIEGLTPVSPRTGPPHPISGAPTVEIPVVMGGPGEVYVNRFYKFNSNGELEDVIGVPVNYDPASFNGWFGYCVCTLGDIPPLYRAITLNCNPGSIGSWKPDPYSDPAMGVSTNNCTASEAWSNPLTWSDYKVPNPATGGFNINRNVTLDVNYDATNKAIYCNNSSALTINSGVTLTSNSGGSFVNNGTMKAEGQYGSVINNGVVSPGTNGIGQFQGGKYTQNTSGTLNIELASTTSFDKLYLTSDVSVLGGTLKVTLLNGFVPVQNNSFNIIEMSYGTYTGTFSTLDLPVLPNGSKWKISYNPTAVTLEVVNCISQTYYADTDGDGFGDAGASRQACEQPSGYVSNNTDCNDNNAAINPNTLWYKDADNDGYSDGTKLTQCLQPSGYKLAVNLTAISGDCNDALASINPTTIWYKDADNDGYSDGTKLTQCLQPSGYKLAVNLTAISGDCNDALAAVNPGATEICGNGIDDNCNGVVDENCTGCSNATALSTTNITSSSASLNWKASANPAQWQVQYKTTRQGSVWIDVLATGDKRSVTILNLAARQDYNWHIRAKCGNSWLSYSGVMSFRTLAGGLAFRSVASTEEKPFKIIIYPNPTNGDFKIAVNGIENKLTSNVLVEIENNYGQLVYSKRVENINGIIDVTMDRKVAAGIYMVHCIINGVNVTKKIVIGR